MKNNKLLKKILAILVIAIVTVALFTSCDKDEDTNTTATDGETTLIQKDEELQKILPNLPDVDWDGYIFKILNIDDKNNGGPPEIWRRDITSEELTGEPINDAVYMRNSLLEEKYNFTIETIQVAGNWISPLRKAVAAGENYFDAVSLILLEGADAVKEGLLVDLFTVNYLDFEKPWWDKGAVAGISIGNRLFFTSGDSVLANKDAVSAMLFNKQMLADLSLENPYELVRRGQWTLSKLYEMGRIAAADLDGNGEMNWDTDRFGLLGPPGLAESMITGAGVTFVEKDADDLPIWNFENDRTFRVTDVLYDIIRSDFAWSIMQYRLSSEKPEPQMHSFAENRGLFMVANMMTVERLRQTETDFGILPMPWLDENQQEWRHQVTGGLGQIIAIPNFHDSESLDRIGFMLEAIASESRYTINPVWYDTQLTGKFIRDNESKEMLDIILDSVIWDTGVIYNWGHSLWSIAGEILNGRNLASWLDANRHIIENDMQATVDVFAEIEKQSGNEK